MSAGHNEAKLLYSVGSIAAYHIQAGHETPLGLAGKQTLSLLMVPTSSPFADLSTVDPTSEAPEEDFYLHLHLPPDLDLPLPATTKVYHQPPSSYLIPRWDLGPDSGAFTRIEFPKLGNGPGCVTQEDLDTFETILAQCTAFQEHTRSPVPGHKGYNPAAFAPGEGYVDSKASKLGAHGHVVLVDEEDGSVIGELTEGFDIQEGKDVEPGSKRPVEIVMPVEGGSNTIQVNAASDEYLKLSRLPAYRDSTLVQNAALASRLIVTGSEWLAGQLSSGADNFTKKTEPNPKPLTFKPVTQARIRKINKLTAGAVELSTKTVGQITKHAQNLGATMVRNGKQEKDTPKKAGYKPGLLNKSMMAFSTVADGVDAASRHLLASGSTAATQVVGHKYGTDAKAVAGDLAGGVKNVGLVYIDATGVSRRAVIKSVAKGMVVGRAPGGGNLVVGGGDGGAIPPSAMPEHGHNATGQLSGVASILEPVGLQGSVSNTKKSSGLGESLGS